MRLSRTSTPAVTRRDWRLIFFYVLAFASGGVIRPFLTIYLVEIGMTGAQIGVLQGVTALITVAVTPLIGVLSDRTQRHRAMVGGILFIKGVASTLMPLSNAWWWIGITFTLRVITAEAHDAIGNRLTLAKLQNNTRLNFGAVRVWGMVAYAATVVVTGWAARGRSASVLFWVAGVMCTMVLFTLGTFPARITEASTPRHSPTKRSPELLFVLFIIFLLSLGRNGADAFVNVFIVEEFGVDNDFIGLLTGIGSLVPIFAYYLADWMIDRWDAVVTLAAGLGCFAVSWGGYLLIDSPWLALPLITLQEFGSSVYVVSMVVLLGKLGRPEHAVTDQMIGQLTVPGLAAIFAQPVSGWMFDALGGRALFALDAAVLALTIALLLWRRGALQRAKS
ncbi:MAG: MFS transporter [Anaerolineae bacterium]|nr:MFS transporter [Anaerolineae bacterium]